MHVDGDINPPQNKFSDRFSMVLINIFELYRHLPWKQIGKGDLQPWVFENYNMLNDN